MPATCKLKADTDGQIGAPHQICTQDRELARISQAWCRQHIRSRLAAIASAQRPFAHSQPWLKPVATCYAHSELPCARLCCLPVASLGRPG
jgi:hypothetical protein